MAKLELKKQVSQTGEQYVLKVTCQTMMKICTLSTTGLGLFLNPVVNVAVPLKPPLFTFPGLPK